ncbi:hypothetical protein GXW78_06175 [Roseomonas terrae]|jgi:ElaB/YqjD/DUF883 family membrane-anchored ribosome-binding protein|uniref:DUF883 domain-containing protein n=1 Tax=Neoroseomonas terrae TaxID=424799 RepID=A0ABS5EDY9_9PROT|nr:hypothetical protein [Neoroseomonas terrae]MBR0649240.1 hypothetical protein [Neoroseomonas terrae]
MSDDINRMARRVEDAAQAGADTTKDAVAAAAACATRAVQTIQANPFTSLGLAALAGVAMGLCMRR